MNKVLVVYKKSIYELYQSSPTPELRAFMEQSSEDVARMRKSHEEQKRTLETVMGELTKQGIAYETAHRAQLGEMRERMQEYDLVVTVGGDGTFLEASHYVEHTPMLGVNSDSNHSVGFYCATNGEHFAELLKNVDRIPRTIVSRLEIILNGKKISEPVLNDVLIAHHNPAAMTRYTLEANGKTEAQRNSGLLICTAVGSTAFMYEEGGVVMPLDSQHMQYHERSKRNAPFLFADALTIHSLTREGMLYLDGEHLQYNFTLGSTIDIRKGPPLTIVGDLEKKRVDYK